MPENEEILNNVWSSLSSDGSTENDYPTWRANFVADPEIQSNVYDHLNKNNNLKAKNKEEWTANVMGKTTTPSLTPEVEGSENTTSKSGDGNVEYKFQEEGGRSAWGRSVDGGEFEIVDANAIPEEWFADENFKKAYDAQNTPTEYNQKINTLLRVKNPETGEMDINKEFFNKEDEDAVALLKAQFGGAYNFEEVVWGMGGDETSSGQRSMSGVRVSTKDNKKSINIEFNVDGLIVDGGKFENREEYQEVQDAAKMKAYEKSFSDLTSFMADNKSAQTEVAISDSKKEALEVNRKLMDMVSVGPKRLKSIEDEYSAEDIFDIKEEVSYVSTNKDYYSGTPQKITTKTQPYEKELKQAMKDLNVNSITTEVKDRAREILIENKRLSIKEANTTRFLEELEDGDVFPVSFAMYKDEPERLKALLEVGGKQFNQEYAIKTELYNSAKLNLENDQDITAFSVLSDKLNNPEHDFKVQEGEEFVTLQDGRKVQKTVIDQYEKERLRLKPRYEDFFRLQNDLIDNRTNIKDSRTQLDLLRRDYNDFERFFVVSGAGFSDLANNFNGITSNEDNLKFYQRNKAAIQARRDEYSKAVSFDDAFSNPVNFGRFAANEFANQVSIFTALAIPYAGWGVILGSSYGEQYGSMGLEDLDKPLDERRSMWRKGAVSAGYAIPELAFELATTLPLLRGAGNGLKGLYGGGFREMTERGFLEFSKDNAPKFITGVAAESLGEGATTVTQNVVTGKPWHENVDHSLFSGLMIGTTLSSVPLLSGAITNQLSDYAVNKEFRENLLTSNKIKQDNHNLNTKVRILKKRGLNDQAKLVEQDIKDNKEELEMLEVTNEKILKDQQESLTGRWLGWGKDNKGGMSEGALKAFIAVTTEQEQLRLQAEKINAMDLSTQEKNARLEKLKIKFDKLQVARDIFKKEKNSEFNLWAAQKKNKLKLDEYLETAEKHVNNLDSNNTPDWVKSMKDKSALNVSRVLFNIDKINENINSAKNRDGDVFKNDLIVYQTLKDAVIGMVSQGISTETIVAVKNGAHGFDVQQDVKKAFIVVENMAKDDRLEIKTHELSHRLLRNAIGEDPDAFKEISETIFKWAEQNDQALLARLQRQSIFVDSAPDEILAVFLEEAAANRIKLKGLGGVLGFMTTRVMSDKFAYDMDFAGESDAIKMLVGLGKKLKAGRIKLKDVEGLKQNKIIAAAKLKADDSKSKPATGDKLSKSPLEAINDLIPKNIKTKEEYDAFVRDRRLFPPVFIATMDDGVISNYVKSKSIGDEYRGAIESVQSRLTNFDPEATRADGSVVGPEGFGEFIFANTRFGKLDSKKALAIKAEKLKQEVRGDKVTETGKTVFEGLVSEETSKKKKAEPKGQKRREIQSLSNVYGVANEIGLNNKIQALIEQNPKNLEAAIKDLIQKDIRKTIAKQMGKISKIQGEVVVSDEYKAFLALNYTNIVQGLDVATIKKNYNQLFELTEIGKEDRRTRKSDKPTLKKDSNYRKGIFKIETNKAKFTKFFTEGGYTTLLDRQKKLAILISESIVEDVVNDQIIENSNDIDTIIQAEIRNYLNKLNRQKKEVRGNYADQIKFSNNVKDFAAGIRELKNPTFDEIKDLYTGRYVGKVDEEILGDIKKIFDRLGPQITVNEFREAAGEAVITRGKGINFTFYDSVKEFLAKAFPEGNVKALDLMTEGGETTFMSGLKGLTALMDPRVLDLSLITNTFLAGNSLYTYSSGTRINSKGKTVPKSISKNEIPSKYNKKGKQDFKGNLKKAKGISSEKLDKVADLVEEYNSKPQTEVNQKELASKIRKLITQENIDAIHSVRDYFYSKLNEYVNQFEEGSVQYYKALAFVTKLLQTQTNASSGISRQGAVLNSVTLDYSTTRKKPRGKGIKRYQFEHNIQLLNFNMNVLKSIIDNKFNKVYPLVSSTYSATLLDADAQLVLDSKDGVTTKEFDSKYPGYKAAATGKTKAAPGFMIGMDSEAMFMIALGNAERTLHIPSGLMYDKLLYNKINKNATLDYLDGVAKKIDSNIKFSKSKKTVFNPANSSKIFKNSKNKSIFNSILQKSIIQEDVTQEVGELAVRIDNSEFFNKVKSEETLQSNKTIGDAVKFSRSANNPTKGITVLDFDDTLATSKSLVISTSPDGVVRKLTAEEFATEGADLLDQGWTHDFSEFSKVVDGKVASLFKKAMKLQGKFGPENMFVLTARPAESAPAIFAFLQANGLKIPLKNITGLANSTSEAKALWIAEKVGEGYNDFYFADDALQNVQAVQNMLDQFDVKSKVQQARVKFSESMDARFNDILENITGIEAKKRFSQVKARKRGDSKGKFRVFIPPSHEDFVGLLYNFMGKGREGDSHRYFWEKALVKPLNRAYREIDTAKQAIANDHKSLNKSFPNVKKKLIKSTPDGDFTFQDAIRVYLWDKHGYTIPGLTTTDQQSLVEIVKNDSELQAYAEVLNTISKQEKYVDPGPSWETGNIRIDLVDATGRVGRKEYFAEFNENVEVIFSEDNLNKIEAAYGKNFRSALEDMLHRIKTGVNRPKGSSAKPNVFMNWLNASVSGVMFFNTRSALLQQMSNVNYLNFADNNIFKAGLAFANQKQYWADFAMIFNSDMMKQRRGGLGTDINGAELAEAIKKARPDNMFDQVSIIVGQALKLGFTPTQIGDNIAIATGGATFYRNRVNTYLKDGMSQKEAEAAAFTDFQNITQSTQQSARPDMTSQQQASWIGKLVLNFLNTPSQYNRIIKKAGSDILNGRTTPPNKSLTQSNMSNMSRMLYYGAAQNLIFYGLQTALFAVMFGGEEDEEAFLKKKERVINGSIDTILRGSGVYGVALSTLKNMYIKFMDQRKADYNKDESAVLLELANFSPVVGIKLRRIVNAEKTINYNGNTIEEMETMDIDNPGWSAATNYVQSLTGAPVNKMYQKTINLRNAADSEYTALQRSLFLAGYTTWSLNLGDTKKMKDIKSNIKSKKKSKKKSGSRKMSTKEYNKLMGFD